MTKHQTILHYRGPVSAKLREDLKDLHEETLPADTLPAFRWNSAAIIEDETGTVPVAYITYSIRRRRLWIDRIGVVEEFRRLGYAGCLLDYVMRAEIGRHADTYIAAHNVASQRLFISRGFVPYATFEDSHQLFLRFSTDPQKAPK